MRIQSTSKKGNFKLLRDNLEVGQLLYTNWFSGAASSTVNGHTIAIKPRRLFSSRMEIQKDKVSIGEIRFNIKGHMTITLGTNTVSPNIFTLKHKGLFRPEFQLYKTDNTPILVLQCKNNWRQLNYDYEVEWVSPSEDLELLIYCGYAANLYHTVLSAV